uniref:Uncharacterized protein n=1 Tax=Molossus molossus TaxID=27622 RepID=A0A7J8I964_MOLMO|nr:hypothetical protein HJG59_010649 [Molossus molossus]
MHQDVASSIPSQDTYPACGLDPPWGTYWRRPINALFYRCFYLSLSLPFSVKSIKEKKRKVGSPSQFGSAVRALACRPASHGFNSSQGHVPQLWCLRPWSGCAGGNQLMWLYHIDVSLCLSLSRPLYLIISRKISSGEE